MIPPHYGIITIEKSGNSSCGDNPRGLFLYKRAWKNAIKGNDATAAHRCSFFTLFCQRLVVETTTKGGNGMRREPLANKDIRFACMEQCVKFWQVALQLGISPETFTRRMRVEMSEDEKKEIYRAMECVLRGR